ncbi:MAG TPA: class I SAM-dependent methyltransferase [Acidimicrobiales bacterium]|nr:class I SAM-dependent methyltransferase [Acidimicrobiales bacterium]
MDRHEWDARYAGDELLWRAEPNRFLVTEAAGLTPGRALDVACGEGRNAVWLAAQGWEVTGVDFSPVALAKAERLAAEQEVAVEWVNADVLDWDPPAGRFDLIVIFYLQLPAEQRRRVHARVAAGLAAGGTLMVVGHDLANLAEGYGGPRDASVLFTPDDVAADLAGLTIVRAERLRRPVSTDAGEVNAIDALVRATRP